jgi:protein-S-isoprenylcysteine O-methyltransferase Ste14
MSGEMVKAFALLAAVVLAMAVLVFAAAGTLAYGRAWVFLAAYAAASVGMTAYLMWTDPALLARRMRGGPTAEQEPTQKIIMSLTSLGFVLLVVVPGFDRRFGWSHMPLVVALAGDALMLAGWVAIMFVFRANTYAASTIALAPGQVVISSGPYAVVRHPMYAAALFLLAGIPIALGSWWGLLVLAAIFPALAWRLLDEEKFLARNLAGYGEYQQRVRWRLLPGVW